MESCVEHHDFDVMELCVTDYLLDIKKKHDDMLTLSQMAEEARELARGLNSKGTQQAVSGTSLNERYENALTKLEEIDSRLSGSVQRYEEYVKAAIRLCPPSKPAQHVVWMRIVEDAKWKQVAIKFGYSISSAKRKYEDGIKALYQEMPWVYRRRAIPDAQPRVSDPQSDRI